MIVITLPTVALPSRVLKTPVRLAVDWAIAVLAKQNGEDTLSTVKKNILVIGACWLFWLTLVAIETLVRQFDVLKPLFFMSIAASIIGSCVVNADAFPGIQSKAVRHIARFGFALLIAAASIVIGVSIATNFKFLLGGHL